MRGEGEGLYVDETCALVRVVPTFDITMALEVAAEVETVA